MVSHSCALDATYIGNRGKYAFKRVMCSEDCGAKTLYLLRNNDC